MTEPDRMEYTLTGQNGLIQQLADTGLNLFACLPGWMLMERRIPGLEALQNASQAADDNPLEQQSFLLIGNAGPAFWAACQASDQAQLPDPVDRFSQRQVEKALTQVAPEIRYRVLYPGAACAIPLQDLGALAGWHQPSPLGIGMHPYAGLWFAYRALVLIDADWGMIPAAQADKQPADHCAQCKTQNCISACPVSALTLGQSPDLHRCADYRLEESSPCQEQCLARNACPFFPEQRYSQEQIRHHYVASLDSLRRYIQRDRRNV